MADRQLVQVAFHGAAATLTLNRPERHNSLVPDLLMDFRAALSDLRQRDDLRVLLLQANGRSFSTGGDVRAFFEQGDRIGEFAARLVGLLNDVILEMLRFPVPIVTAVQGAVTGGSLGFVLASDVVLLAPQASFAPYYHVVGFSPDGGWTALLPQVIGRQRAGEVLLRNLTITADQAVEWGLASRVVAGEQLPTEARQVAGEITSMKPGSVRRGTFLLRSGLGDVADRLEAERREFCQQVVSEEARQGMAAFLGVKTE